MTYIHPNDQVYALERALAATATQVNGRNAIKAPTDNQTVRYG